MFREYDRNNFHKLSNQFNIFVLVGNGFDISVLNKYKDGILKGKTTSYNHFFEFLKYYNLVDTSDVLFNKMETDKQNNRENWSDFENSISDLYESNAADAACLEGCIDKFQHYFTVFLNSLVDADVLIKLNNDVSEKQLAYQSLSRFLKDFQPDSFEFTEQLEHYTLFNYVFANFNYTSLLDNYLYLDKYQFDPHIYKNVDTNFEYYLNDVVQSNYKETVYSSYVVSEVIHPHGIQDIPRSILFGIDLPDYDKGRSKEKRLVKEYWAQYNSKYEEYINKAGLFIIYGMSFGKSDAWWMDKIYDRLLRENVELIIYKYGNDEEDFVKNIFINSCVCHRDQTEEENNRVKDKIKVKVFSENTTYFLGLESKFSLDSR